MRVAVLETRNEQRFRGAYARLCRAYSIDERERAMRAVVVRSSA